MRFLIMLCVAVFVLANELPQAPKPYEKAQKPKVEVSGEIILRYETQSSSKANLNRPSKGSEANLNISIE